MQEEGPMSNSSKVKYFLQQNIRKTDNNKSVLLLQSCQCLFDEVHSSNGVCLNCNRPVLYKPHTQNHTFMRFNNDNNKTTDNTYHNRSKNNQQQTANQFLQQQSSYLQQNISQTINNPVKMNHSNNNNNLNQSTITHISPISNISNNQIHNQNIIYMQEDDQKNNIKVFNNLESMQQRLNQISKNFGSPKKKFQQIKNNSKIIEQCKPLFVQNITNKQINTADASNLKSLKEQIQQKTKINKHKKNLSQQQFQFNFLENKEIINENTDKIKSVSKHKKSNSTNKILINNIDNRQSFIQKANIFVNKSLIKDNVGKSIKFRQSLYLQSKRGTKGFNVIEESMNEQQPQNCFQVDQPLNYSSINDSYNLINNKQSSKINQTTNNIIISHQSHPTQQNSNKLFKQQGHSQSKPPNMNNNYLDLHNRSSKQNEQSLPVYSLNKVIKSHRNTVKSLAYDEESGHLWSASKDYTIRIHSILDDQSALERHTHSHKRGVNCIYSEQSLGLIFSGGQDCLIKVFDGREGSFIRDINVHQSQIMSILCVQNGF